MSEIWFTADTHFGHENIIRYCKRPFTTVREMDETIIENWNKKVCPGDSVYHLGDFAWARESRTVEKLLQRLNGQVHLILGTHDKAAVRKANGFVEKRDLKRIKVGEQDIVLCHYAMRVWDKSHFGSYQLYGHSHGTLPDDENLFSTDVGVDRWSFMPVSFEEIRALLSQRKFIPVDCHR